MRKKAVALISGGLDSTLAVKFILDQGIEVVGLNLKSPFCNCDGRQREGCRSHAVKVAEELKIDFRVMHKGLDYLDVVRSPWYGRGSGINPCVDCRIFSFKKAAEVMREVEASFIVTGEVVGQRPMSQRLEPMFLIEREAGLTGLIVRPLSAKLLPVTEPEKAGIIDRELMKAISGRSRKEQKSLAHANNINDYPCSAGGCLLTDMNFARRLQDYFDHSEENHWSEIKLLQIGRHFRFNEGTKIIVGRDEADNKKLSAFKGQDDIYFKATGFAGPSALVKGRLDEHDYPFVGGIILRYGKVQEGEHPSISYDNGISTGNFMVHDPATEERIDAMRI